MIMTTVVLSVFPTSAFFHISSHSFGSSFSTTSHRCRTWSSHTRCFTSSQFHALSSSSFNGDYMKIKHPEVTFVSPLLEDGYPPAVLDYRKRLARNCSNVTITKSVNEKPILLYLPGFDGTIVSAFLQYPSLGECFDVRGLKVGMNDRSTFDELKSIVLDYLSLHCQNHAENRASMNSSNQVYLMGESFGGILATEVSWNLLSHQKYSKIELKGLILINPATSYLRSSLYRLGPSIANLSSSFQYISSLIFQLIPLFFDKGLAFKQLVAILTAKGLPEVVNSRQREAYMGRIAFDLANRLYFMPQETLKWRLNEWLERGCETFEKRFSSYDDDVEGLKLLHELQTLIIIGEFDQTLPSIEESHRLVSNVFKNSKVHIVSGAGHATTCGTSLNMIKLIRNFFVDLLGCIDDTYQDSAATKAKDDLFGLVSRYDNASIGLSPFHYWSQDNYLKIS